METLFYSTGKAARELGVSQEQVRALCSSAAIDAESTPGGQWRIPRDQLERLKRDGLPPVPRPLPGDSSRPSPGVRHGHPALLAEPSEEVIEAAEEVVVLENEVKSLGLRKQKEQALDWFRERKEEEARRLAAEQDAERERRRQRWFEHWQQYALRSIPLEARNQVEIGLYEAISQVLGELEPEQDSGITRRLVDAAVERVLAPRRRTGEIRKAVEEARDTLPYQMKGFSWSPTESEVRAREAAAKAIGALRPDATYSEMVTTAIGAVRPIIAEFDHQQQCKAILSDLGRHLPGATAAELKLAEEAVGAGLSELPVGTPRRLLEELRDRVLKRLQEIIAKRQAEEQAQQRRQQDQALRQGLLGSVSLPWDFPGEAKQPALEAVTKALDKLPEGSPHRELEKARDLALRPFLDAHAQRKRKAQLIEDGLRGIFGYVLKLERDWDFGGRTVWTLEQEVKDPIREHLEAELSGNEPLDHVQKRVRQMVREALDIAARRTTP